MTSLFKRYMLSYGLVIIVAFSILGGMFFAQTNSLALEEKKLTLNMNKYAVSKPHEKWEFLGFSYHDHNIDLSDTAIRKMQGKIRRKARGLYRWRQKNGYSFEKTAVAMIRSFDNRFYDLTGNNEFTWTRFYFPVLTVSDGLHKLDEYM